MTKTLINIKTDKDVKEQAQRLAKEIGVPLSTVVNAYLKEFIRMREIRIGVEPKIRPEVGRILKQTSNDFRKRKNVAGPFKNAEDALAYLYKK